MVVPPELPAVNKGCRTANSSRGLAGVNTAPKQYQPVFVAETAAEMAVNLGGVAVVCLVSVTVPTLVPVTVEQVFGPFDAVKHS